MLHSSPTRVIGADTVRALATLWVFAGHLFLIEPALQGIDAYWTRLLRPGYLGVAAFFVLSGFLLSMPYWRAYHADEDAPGLIKYLRNRLSRIVPEYYACVLVMALIVGAFTSKWGVIQVLSCLTFTNSLLPSTYMPTWNAPLWSIGIEMSFYLMLPVVAFVVFRLRSRASARCLLIVLMGLIAVGQWLLLQAAPHIEQTVGNVSLFSAGSSSTVKNAVVLFAHFLIGMLAASFYLSRPLQSTAKRFNRYDGLTIAAASLIGLSLLTQTALPGLAHMHYQWPTFPILIAMLLVSLPNSALCARWVEGRFITTTATLSYGFYIWHIPILTGLKHLWPTTPDGRITLLPAFVLTALVCTYAVAWLSYRLIGQPALTRMRRRPQAHPARPEPPAIPRRIAA